MSFRSFNSYMCMVGVIKTARDSELTPGQKPEIFYPEYDWFTRMIRIIGGRSCPMISLLYDETMSVPQKKCLHVGTLGCLRRSRDWLLGYQNVQIFFSVYRIANHVTRQTTTYKQGCFIIIFVNSLAWLGSISAAISIDLGSGGGGGWGEHEIIFPNSGW